MEENKGLIRRDKNGNVRSNENNLGLYSHSINQAKCNGVKSRPNVEYDKLPMEQRIEWDIVLNKYFKKFLSSSSLSTIYEMYADQIKFTNLHRIVLDALEELYNQQSVDNTYNWMKGRNGDNYDRQGIVFTNPTQLAKYIWGSDNHKFVMQVIGALKDLYDNTVYLCRVEKDGKNLRYKVKAVHLIITLETDIIHYKDGNCREVYSYVQLHPVFFKGITKSYIRRRNNQFARIRDYFFQYRQKIGIKQKYMLPPDTAFNMARYINEFPPQKVYSPLIDEATLVEECDIKDFKQGQRSRGRKRIHTALDALQYVGSILTWKMITGKKGQPQYSIQLNKDYYGNKTETKTKE